MPEIAPGLAIGDRRVTGAADRSGRHPCWSVECLHCGATAAVRALDLLAGRCWTCPACRHSRAGTPAQRRAKRLALVRGLCAWGLSQAAVGAALGVSQQRVCAMLRVARG